MPSDAAYSAAAPSTDVPPAAARRKSAIPVLARSSNRSRPSGVGRLDRPRAESSSAADAASAARSSGSSALSWPSTVVSSDSSSVVRVSLDANTESRDRDSDCLRWMSTSARCAFVIEAQLITGCALNKRIE